MTLSSEDIDLPGDPRRHRIVVAMSGGVDSSVSAALLVEAGFEVVGITLRLYDRGAAIGKKGACCAGEDIEDARRVAERLKIPHYVLDYETRFREAVIADFARSYRQGETPIPCVRCNERIKFKGLLEVARDLGAAALATGHYARRRRGGEGPLLYRAADLSRDQSYFLFATKPQELEFLRFPLGGLKKEETRAAAHRFGLPVAEKRDSQDLCFVPQGSYARLVSALEPEAGEPGEIADPSGRVLGCHQGIAHFTVGQRKGLGVAAAEPLYVLRLDPEERRVVVGPKAALDALRIPLGEVNWLGAPLSAGAQIPLCVKLRSTQTPVAATFLARAEGEGELLLAVPSGAAAPGQAAVFYEGERVLGGGWIRRSLDPRPAFPYMRARAAG
jgi:tRNA-uridine 2-sulfurtransferase